MAAKPFTAPMKYYTENTRISHSIAAREARRETYSRRVEPGVVITAGQKPLAVLAPADALRLAKNIADTLTTINSRQNKTNEGN